MSPLEKRWVFAACVCYALAQAVTGFWDGLVVMCAALAIAYWRLVVELEEAKAREALAKGLEVCRCSDAVVYANARFLCARCGRKLSTSNGSYQNVSGDKNVR